MREKQQKVTWDEFFEQEWKPYAQAHKRSVRNDLTMQKQISPKLGSLPLENITRKHFQDFHIEIRNSGKSAATADHFGKLMRRVMGHAVDLGVIKFNQLSNIKLFREDNQKNRFLSQREFESLLKTIKEDKNQGVARLVLWIVCTGCRR
jgi:site-specific recombinase XerD